MAKIIEKKLYLLKRERPEWWKPKEWVQIIINKENMLFIWHRETFKEGLLQIDDNNSIDLDFFTKDWEVKKHGEKCICLLNKNGQIALRKVEKSKEKVEENDYIFSCLHKNVDDLTKEDFAKMSKEAVINLLKGKIEIKKFSELTKALNVMLENSDIYNISDGNEKKLTSIEDLKEILLKKAKDPNANIIDIVRTINSINADGREGKERKLDDIIIDTEEDEEDDFEIEI